MADDLNRAVHRARSSLSGAHHAELVVDGLTGAAGGTAALFDRDGTPRFACDPGSPITSAALHTSEAVLQVDAGDGTTVVFAGRLGHVGVERVGGTAVDIVELRPEQVHLQHAVYRRSIPLADYFGASDDLSCYARQLSEHTNAAHVEELREFVARHTDQSVGLVAAAWLTGIDRDGLAVGWLDTSGGHHMAIAFDSPAQCPVGLVVRVRELLGGSDQREAGAL